MKKIIVALLVLLVLAGCSGQETDLLTSIKEKGKITVALSPDYAPYEFIDPSKEGAERYVGSDVDLAKYIAKELGVELEIVAMSFSDIAPAISNKQYDIGLSGFTYNEERAEVVDFTKAYDHSEASCQSVLVKKENLDNFKTLDNFNGKKVAAQNGSIQQSLVEAQLPDTQLQLITEINDGVLELKSGNVDGVAIACSTAPAITESNPDLVLTDVRFKVEGEDGTMIIVSKNQSELLNALNEIITDVDSKGLYTGWMKDATDLAISLGVDN